MPNLTLCSLASGSTGNCTLLASDTTRILIDAGISARRIEQALSGLGLSAADLQGICVTHEHSDHIQALPLLQRKYGIPLFANAGTVQSMAQKPKFAGMQWHIFSNGQPFTVGDFVIEPYSIPHDAYDPVGYIVQWHHIRIGFATDIGLPTHLIKQRLKGCHALLLETNHDHELLQEADRPWSLKQRIAGRQGHLSNQQAADLLVEVAGPELQCVYLAHLSAECNHPHLALSTLKRALQHAGRGDIDLQMTFPNAPSACWSLQLDAVPAS